MVSNKIFEKEYFTINLKNFVLKFEKFDDNENINGDTKLKYFFEGNVNTVDFESLIVFLEKINFNSNQIKKDENELWDEISDSLSYIQIANNSENIRLTILNLTSLLIHNIFLCRHSFIFSKVNDIKNHTSIPFFGFFIYVFLKLLKSKNRNEKENIKFSDYKHFNLYDIFYL